MIYRAIRKYGHDNFAIYVEYFPDFKKSDLLDLEEQLIKRCGSLKPNGYNILPRGSDFSGVPKSEEHKRKLSVAHTGKIYSDEYKQNMSKIQMGRKFTKQTKDRMYNSSKKGEDNHGAILTENQVREIRSKHVPFKYSMERLASEYGVKRITIQKLIKRVTWKHIN
jgi:group I intron endonuclease